MREWSPSTPKVNDVWHMWRLGLLLRDDEIARNVHALENGMVTIGEDRKRVRADHSPEIWNLAYRPFPYDPAATCPLWEKFLTEALPESDDRELLQEWCGYCLGAETEQQKMLSLYGRSRAGKGTVLRVMEALVGADNVATSSLTQLSSPHGLENMIGKSVLMFGDVRWNNSNVADAVKLLLEISGEDTVAVNPKNRPIINIRLGVRVMFAGNHLPRVNDPSGAFAARLMSLHFTQSFEGREDPKLTAKLHAELPGIFNWALDGADRLAARGAFVESRGSLAAKESVRDNGAGVRAFFDEYLYEDSTEKVSEDAVMRAYEHWKERTKRRGDSTTIETLRPQILEAFPDVENRRTSRRQPGSRSPVSIRVFKGLGIVHPNDPTAPFD